MEYRVVWIDDEYEKQESFLDLAEQKGVFIEPFSSHEEGMHELLNNQSKYHAIILDAKVKKNKGDTTPRLSGLRASLDELKRVESKYYIPYFIYTGQPDFLEDKIFEESYGKFYSKPRDVEKLIKDLKIAVDQSDRGKLHVKYRHVLQLADEKYLGDDILSLLEEILLQVDKSGYPASNQSNWNGLRKVIEKLFEKLNKKGAIPNEVFGGQGSINKSMYFLTRTHPDYSVDRPILDRPLEHSLKYLMELIQDGSHMKDGLNLNVINHENKSGSPYLFLSGVYILIDLLLWFKKSVDDESSFPGWENITEYFEVPVAKDEDGNYFYQDILLNYRSAKSAYEKGYKVKIENVIVNTKSRTNGKYPKFAIKCS